MPSVCLVLAPMLVSNLPAPAGASSDDLDNSPPASAIAAAVLAHHGPGTSGGGSSTISGETLKEGSFDLSLRLDFTSFEHVSREEAEDRAGRAGEFDAVDRTWVATTGLAYGITDDFQIGAQIGWYKADNFVNAELDESTGTVESGADDPSGLTDLWVNAKYRVVQGQPGNVSLVAGIKLPTGNDNQRLDNGELLEPSSQPGSGAVDFQAGAAYSRFLTSLLTIDASGVYTFRTKHDDFKVGDRFDLGTALAYRLTESIKDFPQWSVFGEATLVVGFKDRDHGVSNENTGGTTLFLTPGARVRFSEAIALTLAPSFPALQDLNGDQDKTDFKVAATLSFSF